MKQFSGGITSSNDHLHLNLQIGGGAAYTRVYDNNVVIAIDKLLIVNKALDKLAIESQADSVFYIDQLINLFKSAHIEFLYGSSVYQTLHNAKILKTYLSHLVKKFNATDVLEVLGLTKILLDIDQDVSLGCYQIDTDHPYIDEIQEDADEGLIIMSRQIRNDFNKLCSVIESKQSEIQSAYEVLVNDLKTMIPQ